MFNPINLEKNSHIELNREKKLYICKNILTFTDATGAHACRYQLIDEKTNEEIWLEVKKDRALNYQLFYYKQVEQIEYNPTFLALVGSSTIGYQNPHREKEKQVIYNRIIKKGEIIMPIKHLVSEDELPTNPNSHGYYKDGNDNWYFMTRKSEGTVKRFDNNLKKRSWEYKYKQTRLLIEMADFNDTLTDITIYEGKEITRKDIKKVELEFSLKAVV